MTVEISRPQAGNPGQIQIHMTANPYMAGAGTYTAYCGVVKYLLLVRDANPLADVH